MALRNTQHAFAYRVIQCRNKVSFEYEGPVCLFLFVSQCNNLAMDYRRLCKFPLCESLVKDFIGQIFTGIKSTFCQI